MCGILGVWEREGGPVDLEMFRSSLEEMSHRGPDGSGYLLIQTATGRMQPAGDASTPASLRLPRIEEFSGERFDLVLGHRRLAILDTSAAGAQPMVGERCAIVHSGEVYNFEELAAGLPREWRSRSDTEVLLAGFEAEGQGFIDLLDGMWAFAVYDPRERRLFCSRDRWGMKPFHFVESGSRFAFASEVWPLVPWTGGPARPHAPSVLDFLAWGMTDHREEAFIEGVKVLGPGASLQVSPRGVEAGPASVGSPLLPDAALPDDLGLLSLLGSSVSRRLRSDVPVGTCLSGGLDSSSVVALAGRARKETGAEPPVTFTAVFDEPSVDESHFAETVVRAAGLDQRQVRPTAPAMLDALPSLMRAQGAPVVSSSVYAQYEVMRAAAQEGVKVLLDGQGGDELFGGYAQHMDRHLRRSMRSLRLGAFARNARGAGGLSAAVRRALRDPRTGAPGWVDPGFAAAALTPQPWRYGRDASLSEMLLTDLRYRLPALLRYEERNSMACGVEARLPFLDDSLTRFASSLPDERKISGGVQKAVLRSAMRNLVPDAIIDRRDKVGFATPEREWLLAERDRVRELVTDPVFLGAGYVDPVAVRSAMEFEDGRADIAAWWRWMSLASWMSALD